MSCHRALNIRGAARFPRGGGDEVRPGIERKFLPLGGFLEPV